MSGSVALYNTSYSQYAERMYEEICHETYGLDLGQTGWMTAEEFHTFFDLLGLTDRSRFSKWDAERAVVPYILQKL